MSTFFNDFDATHAAKRLRDVGAARIPRALSQTYHQGILAELMDSERHPLLEAKKVVGPFDTPQNYYYVEKFPESSIARLLMRECDAWLTRAFAALPDNPLRGSIGFNDRDMHWYPESPIGVGFHRDGECFRQLIAIVVLAGAGQFVLADERDDNPHTALRIIAVPGDVILLRANGFDGHDAKETERLHGVFNIRKFRATLSFRNNKYAAPMIS